MKVRRVKFAFVSAAFLAAFATSCGTASASSPSSNTALARAAFAELQKGNPGGAIASFTTAIESRTLEPEMLANALLNRALAYQQMNQDGPAIEDYSSALGLDAMAPDLRATALHNRGLSHHKQGNLALAIQDFTSALLLNPKFAQAFYSRGNALRESGQLLFALSDYDRALRYNYPDAARVHYGSALTYVALRRPLDARRSLGDALSLKPDYAAARQQLEKLGGAAEANVATSEADPILTGSVATFSGGTVAGKPVLPKAVDVPDAFAPATPGKGKAKFVKKYTDRLPTLQEASFEPEQPLMAVAAEPSQQVAIAVEEVPAIPAPIKKPKGKTVEVEIEEPVDAEPEVSAATPEPEAPAAEVPAAEAQPSGWMVQIASANSEDAAWSTWKKMQKRHGILKDLKPIVVKADLGAKGIVYRIRLKGFENQTNAKGACGDLKKNGVECFVSKT